MRSKLQLNLRIKRIYQEEIIFSRKIVIFASQLINNHNLIQRDRSIPKNVLLDPESRIIRSQIWDRPILEHYSRIVGMQQSDCLNVTIGLYKQNSRG